MLGAALFTAILAAAPQSNLLVWGGGTTREAAQEWLDGWMKEATALTPFLRLRPGFPRLDDARTVAGLKPGFVVVTLGVCSLRDTRRALDVLKGVAERAYARPLSAPPPPDACPEVGVRSVPGEVLDAGGGLRLHQVQLVGKEVRFTLRTTAGALVNSVSLPDGELLERCEPPCAWASTASLALTRGPRQRGCARAMEVVGVWDGKVSVEDVAVQTCD